MLKRALMSAACIAWSRVASAQLSILPTTTPFRDILATGTSLGAPSDDVEYPLTAAELSAAGFTGSELLPGGVDILVGNNAALIWNPLGAMNIGYFNANIATMPPSNNNTGGNGNGVRQFIAAYWDDLVPVESPPVMWQVVDGDLIVQWTDQENSQILGGGRVTLQMVVYSDRGPDGQYADFVYQDTLFSPGNSNNDGGSASIGYRDWGVTGRGDVQWSFNRRSVSGYAAGDDPSLPHALMLVPEPSALALMVGFGVALARRR